jgi:hypothetical protein
MPDLSNPWVLLPLLLLVLVVTVIVATWGRRRD